MPAVHITCSRRAREQGAAEAARAYVATTGGARPARGHRVRSAQTLVGNKGYRRFLATPDDDHFVIDRAKAEEDALVPQTPRRSSDRSRAAPFTLSGQLPMCRRMAVEDVLSDCVAVQL